MHTTILFWAIVKPLSFRKVKLSGRMRYIHLACIVIAVVLPILSSLIPLRDGFVTVQSPSFVCFSRSSSHVYYWLVLPVSVIMTTSSSMLVVLFWILFKVCSDISHRDDKGHSVPRFEKEWDEIWYVNSGFVITKFTISHCMASWLWPIGEKTTTFYNFFCNGCYVTFAISRN